MDSMPTHERVDTTTLEPTSDDDELKPEQATFTSLAQRGHALQQSRQDEPDRRDSTSSVTSPASLALQRLQARNPSARCLLLAPSRRTDTTMRFTTIHDECDELEELHATDPSTSSKRRASNTTDKHMLLVRAVVALWTRHTTAAAFRRWKSEFAAMPDPMARIGKDVNLTNEARKIFVAAELARATALQDAAQSVPLLSPRLLAECGINLTRAELDLLIVWARRMLTPTFRGVSDAVVCEVMRFFRYRCYEDGEPLFFEGEMGDQFFVVLQGTVAVYSGMHASLRARIARHRHENVHLTSSDATAPPPPLSQWLGVRVFAYHTGDRFGETSMFSSDASRTASALALGRCEICELPRAVYQRTLRQHHYQFFAQTQKLNFLQRVPLFRDLPRPRLMALAALMHKTRFDFGDALLTERVSILTQCFFVLSGEVKLTRMMATTTTTTTTNGGENDPAAAASSTGGHGVRATAITKKTRPRQPMVMGANQMRVELQTVVANEIVALEALLDPSQRVLYTARAATASVEVYTLLERDARSFLGGAQSSLHQRLRQSCQLNDEIRTRRLDTTRLALQRGHETGVPMSRMRPACDGAMSVGGDSVDSAVQSPNSPRRSTDASHPEQSTRAAAPAATTTTSSVPSSVPPGMLVVAPPPAFREGLGAPYLPQIRATHLFPGMTTDTSSLVHERVRIHSNDYSLEASDLDVVSPPTMLSSCVRKFVFPHSDTLASDYVDRLRTQLWTSSAASCHGPPEIEIAYEHDHADCSGMDRMNGGEGTRRWRCRRGHRASSRGRGRYPTSNHSTAAMDERRVLEQQMSKMYGSKMHWDAQTRELVVVTPPRAQPPPRETVSSARVASPRSLGFNPSNGGAEGRGVGTAMSAVPSPNRREKDNSATQDALHHQLQATQRSARQLIESHLTRVSQRHAQVPQHRNNSFVHFFSDA